MMLRKIQAAFLLLAAHGLGVTGLPAETTAETPRGLIAHWSFDADLGSSVNNGLYAGKPAGGPDWGIDTEQGVARVGRGALRLNVERKPGGAAYLVAESPLLDTAKPSVFTVAGWFKMAETTGALPVRNLVWSSMPNPSFSFGVRADEGKQATFYRFRTFDVRIYSDAAVSEASTPPTLRSEHTTIHGNADATVVRPGVWYHSAVVWNAEEGYLKFYLQGRLVRKTMIPKNVLMEPARGLHIGANNLAGSGTWRGWIDDLAVYDLELTARQIEALAGQSGTETKVTAANLLARVSEPGQQVTGAPMPPLPIPAPEDATQGPALGHVEATEAMVWARVPRAGKYQVTAVPDDGGPRVLAEAEALPANDWCLRWKLEGLRPATNYTLSFLGSSGRADLAPLILKTPAAPDVPAKISLGFGSCAEFPDSSVWTRIADECPDGMVLMGDTPYIDTTELRWLRWAHRRFAAVPQLAAAFQRIPSWSTWDDHDYGTNNGDGNMRGKGESRRAFLEYRANQSAGENGQGIYTRFRRGPVEVFLLDTRWFVNTEPSWADPGQQTTLGLQQWEWLKRGLLASTAPFKLIVSGVIWDRKAGDRESDAMSAHERAALQKWLGEQRISGAILIGGDIHVSRLLKYDTTAQVGYDLRQFITSPLNDRVVPSSNGPSPHLLASAAEPFVFLKVTADNTRTPATLSAEWINRDGKLIFRHDLTAGELAGK